VSRLDPSGAKQSGGHGDSYLSKFGMGGQGGTTPVRLATGALLSNRRLTERAILGGSSATMKVKLGSRHLVEAPCAGGEAQGGNCLVRQWRG
jgi:hypothetical protein